MKFHMTILWSMTIFVSTTLVTMEHQQKPKNQPLSIPLNEIKIDKLTNSNGNSNGSSGSELPTIRLMYENAFEKQNQSKSISPRNNKKSIQRVQTHLEKQIEELKELDPELYEDIMNYKKIAEANGNTTQDIEKFIKENLDKLPSIEPHLYKHLYNAHVEKDEADRKKDFTFNEILNKEKPIDSSAIYSAVLFRSKSTALNHKEAIQKETEKAEPCLDKFLDQIKEKDPSMYAIIMQACENAKNKDQQEAIDEILDAIDKLNPESLQLLMKDIQAEHQVGEAKKEATESAWSKAYTIIGGLVGLFTTIAGASSGTLGGLLGTKSGANAVACTLAQCLVLMNQTNNTNCTNFTG